jgi:hypothetical protein
MKPLCGYQIQGDRQNNEKICLPCELGRMQENFSGCRVLSSCVMSNHFHVLLEVPPMPEGRIPEEVLLKRLSAI